MYNRLGKTALLIVVIAMLGFVMTAIHSATQSWAEPVYSVSTVLRGLRTHPDRWVGRTIFVKGMLAQQAVGVCTGRSVRSEASCKAVDHPVLEARLSQADITYRTSGGAFTLTFDATPLWIVNLPRLTTAPAWRWPAFAYNLPLLGSYLHTHVPTDGESVVRVRLLDQSYCARHGWKLSSNTKCFSAISLDSSLKLSPSYMLKVQLH